MDPWVVVEHCQPLQEIQIPLPEVKDSEVLIQVTLSGACHTDLRFWEGHYDLGGGQKMTVANRGIMLLRAMGHEILGTVAKLGPDVQGLKLGDPRIVFPWLRCGDCRVRETGYEKLCDCLQSVGIFRDGGMASFIDIRHPRYLGDPGDLALAVACIYSCSGTTALNDIRKLSPFIPTESVVATYFALQAANVCRINTITRSI